MVCHFELEDNQLEMVMVVLQTMGEETGPDSGYNLAFTTELEIEYLLEIANMLFAPASCLFFLPVPRNISLVLSYTC